MSIELLGTVYPPTEAEWGVSVSEAGAPPAIPMELLIAVAGIGFLLMIVGLTWRR